MDFIKRNKFNIILLILWLFITTFTMLHHEPWRDETQVWCIVRDLNFIDILKSTQLEGHPVLWYYLVMPFAKLGLNVISMQIISLILVLLGVIILLFKSPFNNFQKTIITLSAGMLYYLPIVARNYALIPVFLYTLAYLYPKRNEKPLFYTITIMFLANTHLLMFAFSGILAIFFIFEQLNEIKNNWDNFKNQQIQNKIAQLIPIALLIINFVLMIAIFYPAQHTNTAINTYKYYIADETTYTMFRNFAGIFFLKIFNNIYTTILFYGLMLMSAIALFKKDKKIFSTFLFSFCYIMYIFYSVWFSGVQYQKEFSLFLIIIFCFWVSYENKNKFLNYTLNTIFIISMIIGFFPIASDIKYNFSGSKQAVQFIKSNLSNEKVLLYNGSDYAISSISAYLPDVKIYSLVTKQYYTFYNFSAYRKKKLPIPKEANYMILQSPSYINENYDFIIFKNDKSVLANQEFFAILKMNK
jgi:hypothetical protein